MHEPGRLDNIEDSDYSKKKNILASEPRQPIDCPDPQAAAALP